jgi:hypothetical protein
MDDLAYERINMEQRFAFGTSEHHRLMHDGDAWRFWGPYLSERAWGTVREDDSPDGNASSSSTVFFVDDVKVIVS